MSATIISTPPTSRPAPLAARLALGVTLLLAIFLHLFRLDQEGFANLYYAATVKTMLTSWHNFLFASFDPGGFVTVDKPPLGFWTQALSATIFGFSGWSLLLPQALAGILSVVLLYHLVARVFGAGAGVCAVLVVRHNFAEEQSTIRVDPMDYCELYALAILCAARLARRAQFTHGARGYAAVVRLRQTLERKNA